MVRIVTLPPEHPKTTDGPRIAGWWQDTEQEGRLLCELCPRGCLLRPGDRGFCFVRENRAGQMVAATYGRSTGFCIDPIEKKPLNHFYPGTAVLSFGTAGCNLGCKFCQNWTTTKSRNVEALCELASPDANAQTAQRMKCRSVAFTYNDPIVWAEYAIDTAKACRERGIKTVAVTSGYINPAARESFYQQMDAANVDLKGFSEEFYRDYTGGKLEPVLDTLRWIVREGQTWLEITNLIIPQANDSTDQIQRMCQWIVENLGPDVPLHFSAFHPDFKMRDRGPTPPETLVMAYDVARRIGLHYVYTGNVIDRDRQATYCPGCGAMAIERDGYLLGKYQVRGGCCVKCGAKIAGRFDDTPGDWGGRRLPVQITESEAEPSPPHPPGKGRGEGEARETARSATASESCSVEEVKRPEKASGPAVASPHPSPLPEGEGKLPARPMLTPEQEQLVFRAAGRRVAAAVTPSTAESLRTALGDVACIPVYGSFVSLKRAGQLRSCCGHLGQDVPLWEALDRAAYRAAKDDPRFPQISAVELPHLDMEVWLLWGLQPVAARGRDRIAAVEIGRHGLQIARGGARGLLLPGVAVEHHLDAKAFLQQVCLKAGLPTDAWLSDDTEIMTFEGYAIHGKLAAIGLEPPPPSTPGAPTQGELASLVEFCRGNLLAMLQGATPNYYLPGGFDGPVHGLAMTLSQPGAEGRFECSKLSLRADMPLQATLYELTTALSQTLRSQRLRIDALRRASIGISTLLDPVPHGRADRPDLAGVDPRTRAMLAVAGSALAWAFDPQRTPPELLEQAIAAAQLTRPEQTAVYSLAIASTEPRVTIAQAARAAQAADARPAAVAGMFYPGSANEISRMLDDLFAPPPAKPAEPWAAALVPHAGWVYSGKLAAKVLARVKIPEQVVVLCPKHRPGGANWAVAPHRRWLLPGGEIAADPELARRLAEAVTGLELDAVAHAQEHAIEVQLPLLARLAPNARVTGITIGEGDLDALCRFAGQLAEVLRGMPARPLLLISSDMNHFADDGTTRTLDRLALDAVEALDPARLYETCRDNRISMCGMRPAVIVMETLRQLGLLARCEVVGYATSAEASGDTKRVVGYAGALLG